MTSAWDVIVVGAGPAGATAATLLARGGRRVAMVDAAHFPRQKVCGEYLSAAAWQLLEKLELGPTRSMGVPLTRMRLDTPNGRHIGADYDIEPAHQPAALSRWKLDAMLVDTACAAGVELFSGFRLREVRVVGDNVTGISASAVADADRHLELTAPLVVAADGRRSRVVQETGRRVTTASGLVGFKRHIRPVDSSTYAGLLAMYAERGGYVGVCPTELGTLNICGLIPAALLQESRGNFAAAIDRWIGPESPLQPLLTAPQHEEDAWYTMPDVARQFAVPEVAGVIYVGDAMGTIEPLAGQGMTMALAGARLAAEFILSAQQKPIDEAMQKRYAAMWHSQFDRRIRAAGYFGNLLRRPRLLAAAIASCSVIPGFAPRMMRRAYGRISAL